MRALGRLGAMRGRAEGRMQSTAAVMRDTGETTEVDGFEVPEWATVYAEVPFRLGGANAGSSGVRTVKVGTTEVQLAVRIGHFPADTDLLHDGDIIEVTTGENADLVLRIVEADWQDQATAHRVPVLAAQRPEEWA